MRTCFPPASSGRSVVRRKRREVVHLTVHLVLTTKVALAALAVVGTVVAATSRAKRK